MEFRGRELRSSAFFPYAPTRHETSRTEADFTETSEDFPQPRKMITLPCSPAAARPPGMIVRANAGKKKHDSVEYS